MTPVQEDVLTERRRPGRDPMPEAARSRLLCEAAASIFLRDGYGTARMDEVARAAGMSKRTLYQLFPSKAALFEATVGTALAPLHLDTELEREPDLEQALIGTLLIAARHLLAPRQTALFRLVIAEGQRSPELAEAFHRVKLKAGASPLQRRIAAEMQAGRLAPGDPEQASRLLFGMVLGGPQMMMMLGLMPPPDDAQLQELVAHAVAIYLRGALSAPQPPGMPPNSPR